MANEEQVVKEEAVEQETPSVEELNVGAEAEGQEIIDEEKDELTLANEKIAELTKELDESENRMARLQADFENYKRRIRLDQEASVKYRAQNVISDLLPALDNFERALKVDASDDKTKSILQGMEMVLRGIMEALQKEGVEVIESVGKQFDPNFHQAVMQVEDADAEPNTVLEEFQKGYKLKDRVIRPTMVKVSQ